MLQIFLMFLVFRFASHIGKIVREKGRAAIGYQVLAVLMWFTGWFGGGVLGASVAEMVTTDPHCATDLLFFGAILGTLTGVAITFRIANSLEPTETESEDDSFRPRLIGESPRSHPD
jgi:hypothetical protein